ncbi:MAG TPA: CopG family transcriptional regulator [Acidimicrobiales bacterium]
MPKERLQILVEPEQRRALEREAERTGLSVGALIRQAIDEHLGAPTPGDRRAAVGRLAARSAPHVEPDELSRLLDDAWG